MCSIYETADNKLTEFFSPYNNVNKFHSECSEENICFSIYTYIDIKIDLLVVYPTYILHESFLPYCAM